MLAIPYRSLLFVSPLAAVEKPPWRWTAEERARVRMDPAQREARITEHRQRARARGLDPGSDGPIGDIIDGNVHPELFYTPERFEKLVR